MHYSTTGFVWGKSPWKDGIVRLEVDKVFSCTGTRRWNFNGKIWTSKFEWLNLSDQILAIQFEWWNFTDKFDFPVVLFTESMPKTDPSYSINASQLNPILQLFVWCHTYIYIKDAQRGVYIQLLLRVVWTTLYCVCVVMLPKIVILKYCGYNNCINNESVCG